MILSIETATTVCGVALVHEGRVLGHHHETGKHIHAERLLSLVDAVLAGRSAAELKAVAVSIGPGSFTGLRIGLSAGKGIAYARSIPMVAVSTLEAIALRAARSGRAHDGETIVPVLDARRDEVYFQSFTVRGTEVIPSGSPADIRISELLHRIADGPAVVTGEAAFRLHDASAGTQPGLLRFLTPPGNACDAGIVGQMGERLYAAGATEDPGALEPRYIKDFFLRTPATTER